MEEQKSEKTYPRITSILGFRVILHSDCVEELGGVRRGGDSEMYIKAQWKEVEGCDGGGSGLVDGRGDSSWLEMSRSKDEWKTRGRQMTFFLQHLQCLNDK